MNKRLLSILLTLCIMLTMLPTVAWADTGELTVTGGIIGTDYSYDGNVLTIKSNTPLTISGSTTIGRIVVQTGVSANITLDNCHLGATFATGGDSNSLPSPFDIQTSEVQLTLVGENTIYSPNLNNAALRVATGATLVVTEDSTGSLEATCLKNSGGYGLGAGIGGNNTEVCGSITINGGYIVARSYNGAGIGSGYNTGGGVSGSIAITGGTVFAFTGSFSNGDAIGRGSVSNATVNVKIIGGNIKVTRENTLNPTFPTIPTNGSNPVYKATFIVPNAIGGEAVNDLEVTTAAGGSYTYGTARIVPLDTNKVYLYLPEGEAELTYDGKTYAATVTTNGTAVFEESVLVTGITNITGTVRIGQTITAGAVTPIGATINYQWQYFDGTWINIEGATNDSYQIDGAYAGKPLRVSVTGTNLYNGTVYSNQTAQVPYTISLEKTNNIGTDDLYIGTVGITTAYAASGDITINYVLGSSGDKANGITFTPGSISAVTSPGSGTITYTINPANATNGVITISATFIHTSKTYLTGFGVSCADITYLSLPSPSVSGNMGGGVVTYYYKDKGATDSTYSTVAPSNAGDYTVKAEVSATADYYADSATADFKIYPLDISTGATVGTFSALTYNGMEQTPSATVTKNSVDVTGSWSGVTNVVDKTTFTANGNFTGKIENLSIGMAKATPVISISTNPTNLQVRPGEVTLSYGGLSGSATGTVSLYNDADVIDTVTIGSGTQTVSFAANGTVNDYTFKAVYSGDSNYNTATSTDLNYSFTKGAQQAVSIEGVPIQAQIYGGTFTVTATGGSGNGNIVYGSTNTDAATIDNSGVVTLVGVGTFKITAYRADDNDYNQSTTIQSADITVNPKVITLLIDDITAVIYSGMSQTPNVVVKDGALLLAKDTDYTVSYHDNINAGTAGVTVTGAGNYAGSTGAKTFLINRAGVTNSKNDQIITHEGNSYDVSQLFTLDLNAGIPAYNVEEGGTGEGILNGNILMITKAGTILVGVTTTQMANYNAGGQVTATLTVNKGTQAAPVGLTKLNASSSGGNDGKILDVNSQMEYSADNKETYQSIQGTEITELSKGNFYVRYKQTDLYNESLDTEIVIDEPAVIKADENAPDGIIVQTPVQSSDKLEIEVTKASVTASEITSIAGGKRMALTLDVTAKVNGEDKTTLSELLKITLPIPIEAKGRRITVYRLHEGTAAEMPVGESNKNTDGEYIVIGTDAIDIYTKNFSQYAIAYTNPSSGSATATTYYKITVAQAEGGRISPDTIDVALYTNNTFTITPNEGYEVVDVVVNGESIGAVTSYIFKQITSNCTITATFQKTKEKSVDPNPSAEWKNPFADVSKNDWFFDSVRYVSENGLMNGTEKAVFSPNANVTRAMFVTILYRAEKEPNAGLSPFTDVESGSYYEKAVAWAASNGIVKGISETAFAPNNSVTREQMAAMLYRYAQSKGQIEGNAAGSMMYEDSSEISDYALEAMKWTVSENLIKGKTETTVNPKEQANRAEMAAILMRYLELLTAQE